MCSFARSRFAVEALRPIQLLIRKGTSILEVKNTMKLHLSVWTAGQRPNPRTLEDVFNDSPSTAITITINSLFFEINMTPKKS